MGIKEATEVIAKTPEETRKAGFDFTGDDLAEGEALVGTPTPTITVSPTGDPDDLVAASPVIVGNTVQLTLTKGRAGFTYTVHLKVNTDLGQVLVACGRIMVDNC